jgi:dTDP-4-amino-4,6-dideoxygalactose transaminase
MTIDSSALGISRESIIQALLAEGVEGLSGSYQNLHLLPMYQNKIAYGSRGFPWTSDICKREVSYQKGICPVAEELNDRSYLGFAMCAFDLEDEEVDLIVNAFTKVWSNLDSLMKYEQLQRHV